MNSITYPYSLDPYIPTEETMFMQLEKKGKLSDEWELHKLPLAHLINTKGVSGTQKIINEIKSDKRKIFVCQHILVDQLKISQNDVMCSPHAKFSNDIISIPHYPVNISKKVNSEKKLFGFVGSISTHPVRNGLVKLFPENCKDSGVHWGLDKSLEAKFREFYVEELEKSHFALCPRGTGISSVRLFEAMASGIIPVIIADGYKPPLSDIINWDSISVSIKEKEIKHIPAILKEFILEDILEMRKEMIEVYQKYLSPDNFHKSIELALK